MTLPAWDQVQREFHCDHAEQKLVKKTASNGTVHLRLQCQQCGHEESKKKSEYTGLIPTLPESDDSISRRWYERRTARYRELAASERHEHDEKWWSEYNDYLLSDKWRKKRQFVLNRDRICQACLSRPATQVHHLTYKHLRNEPLFELVGVCRECHDKITALDRGEIA